MNALDELRWPAARAGEALASLADAAGLGLHGAAPAGPAPGDPDAQATWLDEAARWRGVDLLAMSAPIGEVSAMIAASAPALLRTDDNGVLAVLAARGARATLVAPDGARRRVPLAALVEALVAPVAAPHRTDVDAMLVRTQIGEAARARAAPALVAMRLRGTAIGGLFALRLPIEAELTRAASAAGIGRRFAGIAALHAIAYGVLLVSWWAIGRAALTGRLDNAWLLAWAALLAAVVAARGIGLWSMSGFAIDVAAWLKQRLLAGALRLDGDALRAEGVGRSLGRVFEGAAVEQLALAGGFAALFAAIELVATTVVLGAGAGGGLHVALFTATLVATGVLARRYVNARRAWTSRRLGLTHDLIETMVGHATRLAQETPELRHQREDRALAAYTTEARAMDRALTALQALIPRGWMVIGVAGLLPAVVGGDSSTAALAVALGGVLLGMNALTTLVEGVTQLADAAIAWRAIEPLVEAGGQPPATASPGLAASTRPPSVPVATVRGVTVRVPRRSAPVLEACDLVLERGDRVLLEGPSGAGKSTLAAMLAGLRRPDSGLVLAGGLDRASLGESGWRRRVACAPQFHDNHLFSAPLAFNLLVGRGWPPRPDDLAEAYAVCDELGLRDVIDRMPAGLHEMVGETGWQLSHGERCRVFLARALLQGSELVVLDESLAALDPATMARAIKCIERRAGAALVIAHP